MFKYYSGKDDNRNNVKVEVIIPKDNEVYKYAPIPDLYDSPAKLEESYLDYRDLHLVAIHKNGHILYYLEVLVDKDETKWGDDDLVDFI